jgi:hypothetical protein
VALNQVERACAVHAGPVLETSGIFLCHAQVWRIWHYRKHVEVKILRAMEKSSVSQFDMSMVSLHPGQSTSNDHDRLAIFFNFPDETASERTTASCVCCSVFI